MIWAHQKLLRKKKRGGGFALGIHSLFLLTLWSLSSPVQPNDVMFTGLGHRTHPFSSQL